MPRTTLQLTTLVADLPGVQQQRARALADLGIAMIADLVKHAPHRYELHHGGCTIAEGEELLGEQDRLGDLISIDAIVDTVRPIRGRPPRVEAVIEDDSGRLDLVWFNQQWVGRSLHPDMHVRIRGTLHRYKGRLQMTNPRFEELDEEDLLPAAEGLVAIYPASEHVSSTVIGRLVERVLDDALPQIEDHLDDAFRRERSMPALADAWATLHRPACETDATVARRRLIYDEFLLLQLGIKIKQHERQSTLVAPSLRWDDEIRDRITARVPFTLTGGQSAAIEQIAADLQQSVPMNRLLQGDVGSGKTVVAVHAMLTAIASGHQAALMAPTELLAEQHQATLAALLTDSKVRVALLTSSCTAKERADLLVRIEAGEVDLLIGTHALLTEDVSFASLAVAIIDEQHRFGVHQRHTLHTKAGDARTTPHVLIMTATPIPRSLALTHFGDLDISTIRGLPPGRQPVVTRVVSPENAQGVYEQLAATVADGRQGYVVVPMIQDTDSDLKNVTSHAKALAAGPLAAARIGTLHGRMHATERAETMEAFRAGDIDVLVATTVIEVGVDVPNSTMMVIEHADRFGLAQLHQLRGRIGRGNHAGSCVLVADATTDEAGRRLDAIAKTSDGYEIADADMRIRGVGEIFGSGQSGWTAFRLANPLRDHKLLDMARRDAAAILEVDPDLSDPARALLRGRMRKEYGEHLGLGGVR